MATSYKVLGQVNPSATTQTTLYTVPAETQAIVSTLVIANLTGTPAVFRIAVRPAGEALVNKHYIAFDVVVGASDSTTLTLGLTLNASDVLAVYASSSNVSFSAFGSEINS
jgi:hypothetical protein